MDVNKIIAILDGLDRLVGMIGETAGLVEDIAKEDPEAWAKVSAKYNKAVETWKAAPGPTGE